MLGTLLFLSPCPGNILKNEGGTEVLLQALPGWEDSVLWRDGARASPKCHPRGRLTGPGSTLGDDAPLRFTPRSEEEGLFPHEAL